MNKPRFNLKNKSDKETLISLIFRPFKERLNYSTGFKVHPKYWNDRTMRLRQTQEFLDFEFINAELDKLESFAKKIAKEYRRKDMRLTSIAFRKEMDQAYKGIKRAAVVKDFSTFLELFIDERENSPKYSNGSIQVYNTAKKHITAFAGKKIIKFEDLTIDFFLRFIQYLFSKKFSDNHINKILGTIRTMLNDATERGYNTNLAYKSRKFSVPKTEADNVYLNEEDLLVLYNKDLEDNEKLDRVRDLFLVAAYTGLRYSDFTLLQPHNIRNLNGQKVFDTTVGKTKDRVLIPIHPIVASILKKYNNKLPKPISNQKMNDYLKELCKIAELDEEVIRREHRGGKMYEVAYPKYKLVSSHTGRRSFATNAYKNGVPMLSIMRITGHKKPETFLKYIKFDNEENALLMAKHEFFKAKESVSV